MKLAELYSQNPSERLPVEVELHEYEKNKVSQLQSWYLGSEAHHFSKECISPASFQFYTQIVLSADLCLKQPIGVDCLSAKHFMNQLIMKLLGTDHLMFVHN